MSLRVMGPSRVALERCITIVQMLRRFSWRFFLISNIDENLVRHGSKLRIHTGSLGRLVATHCGCTAHDGGKPMRRATFTRYPAVGEDEAFVGAVVVSDGYAPAREISGRSSQAAHDLDPGLVPQHRRCRVNGLHNRLSRRPRNAARSDPGTCERARGVERE
jgi:hypothetical protein